MSSKIAAPKSTATPVTNSSRHALFGVAISAIGLAYIARPELFESLNRQMFTRNIRRHVYINGAIETLLGVAVIAPRARRFVPVLGALYVSYLGGNIIRRRRASPGGAERSDWTTVGDFGYWHCGGLGIAPSRNRAHLRHASIPLHGA